MSVCQIPEVATSRQLEKLVSSVALVRNGSLAFRGSVLLDGCEDFMPSAKFVMTKSPQTGRNPPRSRGLRDPDISFVSAMFSSLIKRVLSGDFDPVRLCAFEVKKPLGTHCSVDDFVAGMKACDLAHCVHPVRLFQLLQQQPHGESCTGQLAVGTGDIKEQKPKNWFLAGFPGGTMLMNLVYFNSLGWHVDASAFYPEKFNPGDVVFVRESSRAEDSPKK